MFRKTLLAVAATAVIAGASVAPASAHPHFGWGWGGVGFGLGVVGASIAASNYYAGYDNCYQYQNVVTPRGHLRRILVNVCD